MNNNTEFYSIDFNKLYLLKSFSYFISEIISKNEILKTKIISSMQDSRRYTVDVRYNDPLRTKENGHYNGRSL